MLVSVPLLAFAGKWQIAALFIILERLGKAVRSPGKDAMLSHATKQIGTGLGFGISEALDQIDGFIGPLVFTVALSVYGEYKYGFNFMWIPAILTVVVVLFAKHKVPKPSELEELSDKKDNELVIDDKIIKENKNKFILYGLFVFLSVLGFANFPIISYHFGKTGILDLAYIPMLYGVAMAVDGVFALVIGKAYDKKGFVTLILIPVLTIPIAFLGFSNRRILVIISVVLWGCVMSIHETIMKATIADITTISNRGKAYGLFNTIYGVAMLIGSTIMGYLYDKSIIWLVTFIIICEVSAIIVYFMFRSQRIRS